LITDPTAVPTSPHLSLVIQCPFLRVKSQLLSAARREPRSGTKTLTLFPYIQPEQQDFVPWTHVARGFLGMGDPQVTMVVMVE
jgi:hypothetical protein